MIMNKFGFLSLGLIGGSIALALRQICPGAHITAYARRQSTLDEALAAVDEALPADAQRDGSRVLMTFASPSGRTLDVELTITANATYEISQWKATTQWTNDGPGATLWSGAAQTR